MRTHALTLLVLLAAGLAALPAAAQFNRQDLPASAAGSGDWFGQAVAVDGDYAAVGQNNAVYFYRWTGASWVEDQRVDVPWESTFGRAVALSGTCAVVGADGVGQSTGEAYVYCRTGTGSAPWVAVKTLTPAGFDVRRQDVYYGAAVAIDGDVIVVGARQGSSTDDRFVYTGAVYVYHRDAGGPGNWGLEQRISLSSDRSLADLGESVDVRGRYVIAGAPGQDEGRAYLWERGDGGTLTLRATLDGSATSGSDDFGYGVALGDGFAVVGARDEDAGGTNTGKVYAFRQSGTAWTQTDTRKANDTGSNHRLGTSVAVDGAFALVGAPGADAAYVFEWNGSVLTERAKLTGPRGEFGHAVAFGAGSGIVGARYNDAQGNDAGAASAFVLIPRTPGGVAAADGSSTQQISVSWSTVTGADNYRVYRDAETTPIADLGGTRYDDPRPPAQVHTYRVTAYNSLGESPAALDVGRTRANGEIRGAVTVAGTAGVGVADVRLDAGAVPNEAVDLSDPGAYVEVQHTDALDLGDAFTVEAWIMLRDDVTRQALFSTQGYGAEGGFQLEVGRGSEPGGTRRVSVTSGGAWALESYDFLLPIGVWQHVAYVRDGDAQRLVVNGRAVSVRQNVPLPFQNNDDPKLIGAGTDRGQRFVGPMDEVRLWKRARTDAEIARDMNRQLAGDERDLAGYWRLDDVGGAVAADLAGGSHGTVVGAAPFVESPVDLALAAYTDLEGRYAFSRLDYGEGTTYTLAPQLEGHGFDPAARDVYLSGDAPSQSGVNFADTTTFTIAGRITFAAGGCPQPGVEILVNDVRAATTDADGRFTVAVQDPSGAVVRPVYGEHAFDPAERVYDVLLSDVGDADFANVETRTLDGRVVGGDCGLALGDADVTLYGPAGCSFQQKASADAFGAYTFTGLPAFDVVTLEAAVPGNPLVQFAPQDVSLADADTTADFIYRAPPQVTLRDFPAPPGACGVPVLQQLETYGVYIEVKEDYGGQTCAVEDGVVVVRNELADAEAPDTLQLDGQALYYEFTAGGPNITGGGARPYQKQLGLEIITGGGVEAGPYGYNEAVEQWAVVEGNRPREKTFATVTPELPLMILRDPPGDESYSYLEQGARTCTALGVSALDGTSENVWGKVKLGRAFSIGGGIGVVSVSTDFAVWGEVGGALETGSELITQTESEVCMTATERFTTSDDGLVTGAKSDVFVGGAMNFLYALTDVLDYDEATCRASLSQDVIFAPDQFATTYLYTEDFIRSNLVPRLEGLRDNPNTPADSVQYLADQVEVWQQTLALNETLKEEAAFVENLSFSAGAGYGKEITSTTSTTRTVGFNLYVDEEVAVEAGLEVSGSGLRGGYQTRWRTEVGASTTTSTTYSNTVGYVLGDGDPQDSFTLDVKSDPVYGTPVFELVSGESSCPWEPGTRPRDVVALQTETFVRSGVDPDGPAAFQLTLSNPAQSETDADRQYFVRALQESNPDGAVLRLGGDAFSAGGLPFTVPARGSVQATLTVERGPEAFTYENLRFMAYPQCEYENWQNNIPLQIADTLAVTVYFESPCSPVTLALPEGGWTVNAASGGTMQVVARDYDREALSNLKLQVSPAGKNDWQTVQLVQADALPADQLLLTWDVRGLADGAYDVRLAAACNAGVAYSAVSTGVVDRTPPRVFGAPRPGDGVLAGDDGIGVTFTEALACDALPEDAAQLVAARDGAAVAVQTTCEGRELALALADADDPRLENATLRATVAGVADRAGNVLAEPVTWSFRVNRNPVAWTNARLAWTQAEGQTVPVAARLANAGGTDAAFTLAGVPDWLTPDRTEGTLPPGGEQAVVFTPQPGLAQGVYRDTLVARTPGGDEALAVELAVQCTMPDWTFTEADAAAFAYRMDLVSGFYIDGVPFADAGDRVAAFVGDELRGAADVVRVVPQDEWAVFLPVYSDAEQGETVTFRLWDASECAERAVATTVPFERGVTRGSAEALDALTVSGAVLQALAVNDGWTWLSLGVEAVDMRAGSVLRRLGVREGDVIRGQTGYSQYVAGTGWVGTLDALQPGVMYQLRLDSAQTLEFIGEPVDGEDRPLAVESGWNWVGYLPDAPLPLTTALASLSPQAGDVLRSQSQAAEFTGAGWQGSLAEMRPGEGYLLRLGAADTLTYPGARGQAVSVVARMEGAGGAPDWSVEPTDFEHVMTVTGAARVRGVDAAGADRLVAAFVGDEVRGVARPRYVLGRWVFFLNVYADAQNETVTFRLYDAAQDRVLDLGETLDFQAVAAVGTPREPFAWNAVVGTGTEDDGTLPAAYALEGNYPNPFNPTTTIRYALRETGPVRLTVYNVLGQQVAVLVDAEQPAGRYTVTFDARELASGLYLYHLEAGGFRATQTMTLVK